MDLDERECSEWGYKLLNRYLSLTGDYGLLPILRFYQVYRSMVRAKVLAIRLGQLSKTDSEYARLKKRFQNYLELATSYTSPSVAALVLTYGHSGSGKSWYCKKQFSGHPIVVVRSDIERKRLAGLSAGASSDSSLDDGIYHADFSKQTYDRLLECVIEINEAGLIAVVDAAFLKSAQRKLFLDYAECAKIGKLILSFDVDEEVLRKRIDQRVKRGGDPSEADGLVLDNQLEVVEPLSPSESEQMLAVTERDQPSLDQILGRIGG